MYLKSMNCVLSGFARMPMLFNLAMVPKTDAFQFSKDITTDLT